MTMTQGKSSTRPSPPPLLPLEYQARTRREAPETEAQQASAKTLDKGGVGVPRQARHGEDAVEGGVDHFVQARVREVLQQNGFVANGRWARDDLGGFKYGTFG